MRSEGIWSVAPDVGQDLAVMAFRSDLGPEALRVVQEEAQARGLAILETGAGRFIQAGYGERAGASNGQYAVEYQGGSPRLQWRAVTPDITVVIRSFIDFAAGGTDWTKRLSFKPVEHQGP
ncbi:hypothetical protein [Actinoplanes sp. N902-109]|uniref:hypothetical protein n=1 Tax=Actinoplanes sp. (strain N902-109) TaxID=649831 RepID=UPI00032944B4|nr:hypothetical protein [Actinoplanes sp. N902-109]AGL18430.1 hypothetical protein L083_4920 [Actinoplanes sp. N902-109]